MSKRIKFVITDYIERDLKWEEEQCQRLGIDFSFHQLRDASADILIAICEQADIVLTNMAKFTEEVMNGITSVKVLLRHGIGYDNIDVPAATKNGIVFANEATASSEDVAEHAIMLILETYRKRKLQEKALLHWIRTGQWSSQDIYPLFRMKGKTLGIIGCGNIGSRLLNRMRCFGMNMLVCDPYLSEERYRELEIRHTPFETVLRQSDIITIHVPVTDETRGMFKLAEFNQMKPEAVIINTSRGPIIHTEDLVRALREKRIMGAGLDVYEDEPPGEDSELLKMDNVMLTPHVAWYSEEGGWDIRYMIMDDVKAFIEGRPPQFVINHKVFECANVRFRRRE
ncbi:MAG: 2-hydroxyacid dehydrogenase [Candidatus Zhuqueibacterota bacterium]